MGRLPILELLNRTFKTYKIGGLNVDATYWQVGAIILLVFLLVFTLARLRYLYVHWSLSKNSLAMLFWGFVLAVIVEGFFMLSGRTIFTQVLGIKNVPKPFSTALDLGRSRMENVLGTETTVPSTDASSKLNSDQMYSLYKGMDSPEAKKLQQIICTP